MLRSRSLILRCLLPSFAAVAPLGAAVDFVHEVAPVLKQYCADCHLGSKRKGGFSMNTRAEFLAGSENGKVAEPGKPADALLLKLLESADKDEQMPPKGDRVPPAKIAVLRAWIAEGMTWEDGFTFGPAGYEPPLKPRRVELPPVVDGRTHPIDRILDKYMADHKVPRPQQSDDLTFARRVSMDVLGLIPEPETLTAFAEDNAPGKRARFVSAQLAREQDYAEHWLTFWNDLLRNDYQGTGYIDGGRKQISAWLYRALVTNMPYDRFARELLAPPTPDSAGFINGIKWRGNVNASQVREIQFSQSISQVFLGINMKCASCHDSFIDRWKLDDAYALAAIYSDHPLEIFRCDKATGKQAKPGWIFPELGTIDASAAQPERLRQLAGLMTHPDNGRFTRTLVNRIWHRLMGHGIVHPVDAMHTEPWSADLLDWLSVWFAGEKYDVRKLIAFICRSEAYQARTVTGPEAADAKFTYRGPVARRLTAEQFVDAVWRLTGTAPPSAHNSVPRGKPGKAATLTARWIWSGPDASAAAPSGQTIWLRKALDLPAASTGGHLVVSCDNECEVFVNGKSVGTAGNWEAPTVIALPKLRKGPNTLTVKATNGGSGPNPAGLWLEGRVAFAKLNPLTIASGQGWEWAPTSDVGAQWKPAAELKNQDVWARVSDALKSALGTGDGGGVVRASVVASDLLMRALGRPNREQIVSMRPENLTTLEAIDLANGGILANLLKAGAPKIMATWKESADPAGDLFFRALSRRPTPDESAVMRDLAGAEPTPQSVEDLLWMLIMLPEFQFVR